MLNHIVIMGRLTRDPEVRYTQANPPVTSARFSVAVERDFGKDENGQKQTDFIDCVAWRQTADFVSKYFTKGQMAVVSGRLQIRDWTDREGGKRRSAEIVADNVYFGESKRSNNGDNAGYSQSSYTAPQGGYAAPGYSAPQGSYSAPQGNAFAPQNTYAEPKASANYEDPFGKQMEDLGEDGLPF